MAKHSSDDEEFPNEDQDLKDLVRGDAELSADDTESTEEDEIDPAVLALLGNGEQEEMSEGEVSQIKELIELTNAREIEDRRSAWREISYKIYENGEVANMFKGALIDSLMNLHGDPELTVLVMEVLSLMSGTDDIIFTDEEIGKLLLVLKDLVSREDPKIVKETHMSLGNLVEKYFAFAPIVAVAIATKTGMSFSVEELHELMKTDQLSNAFSANKMILFILVVGYSEEFPNAMMILNSLECTHSDIEKFRRICPNDSLVHNFLLGCIGVNGPSDTIGNVIGNYFSQEILEGYGKDVGGSLNKMLCGESVKVKNILVALETMANTCLVDSNIAIKGVIETVFSTVMRIMQDSSEVEVVTTFGAFILCEPLHVKTVKSIMQILNKIAAFLSSKSQDTKELIRSNVVAFLISNVRRDPQHDPTAVAEVEKRIGAA